MCLGCCCGRVDKGKPAVPVEWLKAEWKRLNLLKHVHLTIGGCLGPCEIANVVAIATPDGTTWLGEIDGHVYFAALVDWAAATAAARQPQPLPAVLETRRFERFESRVPAAARVPA